MPIEIEIKPCCPPLVAFLNLSIIAVKPANSIANPEPEDTDEPAIFIRLGTLPNVYDQEKEEFVTGIQVDRVRYCPFCSTLITIEHKD